MATVATAPDPDADRPEHQQQEHGVKRRQSEEPEEAGDSKRQRTSPGKNSPTTTRDHADTKDENAETIHEGKPTTPQDTRRKSSAVDEKQRSKRLFGALLGNLRQPGDRTSKRRQEIETRRKAELQKQDDERLEDRQRRQEQLAEQRRTAQVKVDEENMHRRHKAMLDRANFLQTDTEPRLFYRPWELRDDEEDRIDDQVKDVQDLIDKEFAEFNSRYGRKSDSTEHNSAHEPDANNTSPSNGIHALAGAGVDPPIVENAAGGEHASAKSDHEEAADASETVSPTNNPTTNHEDAEKADNIPRSSGAEAGHDNGDGEDDGEHAPEGDEDAVIY